MDKLFRRILFSVSVSALITLAVGLGLTTLLFVSVRRVESERQNLQFQQSAKLRTAAVATGLQDAVEQLMVLNQLFRSVGVVSHEQFRTFTAPLLERYPQIQAFSFQRLVMQRDRHAYETAIRRRTPDFTITEVVDGQQRRAAIRDSYNVVAYIEPVAGNEAAVGLDTAVTTDQAQARLHSRASGQVAATGLLSLVQYKGRHAGFLVVAPVYLQGAPLDTVAARHRAVIGETAAVFRVDNLIDTILGADGFLNAPGMAIRIYAGPSADPQNLAFRHGTMPLAEGGVALGGIPLIPRWLLVDRAEPVNETFNLAGSPWHMEVAQAAIPFTANHSGSLYALLGGILSSALAAAYVYALVSRTATIERVTSARTAALQFANLCLSEDIALRMHTEKSLRLGGDEFVLMLPEHTEDGPGLAVLQRIMDAVAQPLAINEHEFFLTCSIGVATYPTDGNTAESLTKHADIAMYHAKEMGRNTFQFYTAAMNERTLDRLSIETDLRHALERDEFVIHYQPQVNLCSGRIVGMEALIRWNHPVHGLIPPARFIGLAEEMGLIIPIGAWIIRTVCIQTKAWQQAGLGDLRVAVNLSPRQFTQKALVQSIADVLQATGLEPRFLELELTESLVMSDVDNAIAILRTHGCDQMQGYYFSRPIAADAFGLMLQERSCLPGPANN